MKTASTTVYTLVRHSAFTVRRDPVFQAAVELRSVSPREAQAVISAGGLIFNSYSEASERQDAENYPPSTTGLVPAATGRFVKRTFAEVYIPARP